jgi:hypothetical protein
VHARSRKHADSLFCVCQKTNTLLGLVIAVIKGANAEVWMIVMLLDPGMLTWMLVSCTPKSCIQDMHIVIYQSLCQAYIPISVCASMEYWLEALAAQVEEIQASNDDAYAMRCRCMVAYT